MPRYAVYLVTTASTVIEVEAEDGEDAIEKAFEQGTPTPCHQEEFDLGDWTTSSELFPQWSKPEDDYEIIEE